MNNHIRQRPITIRHSKITNTSVSRNVLFAKIASMIIFIIITDAERGRVEAVISAACPGRCRLSPAARFRSAPSFVFPRRSFPSHRRQRLFGADDLLSTVWFARARINDRIRCASALSSFGSGKGAERMFFLTSRAMSRSRDSFSPGDTWSPTLERPYGAAIPWAWRVSFPEPSSSLPSRTAGERPIYSVSKRRAAADKSVGIGHPPPRKAARHNLRRSLVA